MGHQFNESMYVTNHQIFNICVTCIPRGTIRLLIYVYYVYYMHTPGYHQIFNTVVNIHTIDFNVFSVDFVAWGFCPQHFIELREFFHWPGHRVDKRLRTPGVYRIT